MWTLRCRAHLPSARWVSAISESTSPLGVNQVSAIAPDRVNAELRTSEESVRVWSSAFRRCLSPTRFPEACDFPTDSS
jgi:hypothetical protein